MQRRELITLLGGAAAAWPLAARAQQAIPVVGFLNGGSADAFEPFVLAFREGMRKTGFTDGQNVAVEYRWAEGRIERLPPLAADLVQRRPAVIVATGGDNSAFAAKAATATIPVVFVVGADPAKSGLVAGLARPGGNATGVSLFSTEVAPKQLDLLREMVGSNSAVGMIVNPSNPNAQAQIQGAQEAARARGIDLHVVNIAGESDFEPAFASLKQHVSALMVGADGFFTNRRYQLVGLAARHGLPAMYFQRALVTAGGLMSYGSSIEAAYRQAGTYAGSIIKGIKPTELPVLLPTKFDFVINLQTAKVLGRELPPTLLALADEVIE
jgi:putative ABC transport system substrate-binding protein